LNLKKNVVVLEVVLETTDNESGKER
jgi:hypothetical protein